MIRRISNKNDYIDIVRSCPSGVIDDIYEVEYYVDGYSNVYSASFSKKGSLLEVIIPSSALQTLPSGLLMRRAKYRNEDPSFPDGNYDLEFVEDMNVWLESGSGEPGPGPVPGEYLTADDLKTINNQSLVGEGNIQINPGVPAQTFTDHVIGNIQAFSALDSRVTALEQGGGGGGVSQEQFNAHAAQNDANFSGIDQSLSNLNQLVQKAQSDAGDAIQENIAQDARMDAIDDRITNDEVHIKAVEDITDTLSDAVNGLDQRVNAIDQMATDLAKADFQGQIDGLDQRVTDLEQGGGGGGSSWGSITGDIQDQSDLMNEFDADRSRLNDLENSGFVTEQWVDNKLMTDGYLTEYMADQRYPTFNWIESVGYATESWVSEQGYAVNDPNDPFITESVLTDVLAGDDNRVLREDDLGSYAQMSWVQGQGYLTSSSTLPADQITCNISGDVFDFENVDEGLTALVSKVEEQIDDITSLDTRVTDLENAGYATETWVQNQDYASDSDLDALDARVSVLEHGGSPVTLAWGGISGTITDQTDLVSYIGNQGFLTSSDLSGYATQSWVGQQGYITSSALSGYATESWVTNQFLEKSSVWTGTEAQWNQLTAEQKAMYIIALITQ